MKGRITEKNNIEDTDKNIEKNNIEDKAVGKNNIEDTGNVALGISFTSSLLMVLFKIIFFYSSSWQWQP